MNIVNPNYAIRALNNIFNIREKEYNEIENKVSLMLNPALEAGFTISKFGIKDVKVVGGELNKSSLKNLVIKLLKGTNEVDLSMFIPKLVDKNYIVIGGRRKIPLFQLFDLPIVTRGENIKLRTNIATFMIDVKKEFPFVHVTAFGKSVPLAILIFAKYGLEETERLFNLNNYIPIEEPKNSYEILLNDLKDFYLGSENYTKDDFIKDIGKFVAKNYDLKTKGEDFLYSLEIIPKVDIMTARFFHTESIIDELIYAMRIQNFDDTDFKNKRLRCFEYVILAPVAKAIFDLCMSARNSKNVKFKVNSKQIISACNVSDIVQFDFSINPIEDLTKLSRVSILGPGGFKRDNVPKYLRDINDTMFGRLCPVDTPDRENCGILQNLLVNTKLEDNLKFSEERATEQPISIPVSFVPFCEHDDQTRLQMASSQARQAIMLHNFDEPMIKSGCEGLYTDYTSFVKRARKNGEVIYLDSKKVIIIYDDKDFDIFDIGMRNVYVENIDLCLLTVDIGDRVKKGDIIAESTFCKNGSANIGRNLLTGYMIYHGYNYEDGIVISETAAKKLKSLHHIDLSFTIPPDKVLLNLSENEDEYCPLPFPNFQKFVQVSGNPNNIDLKSIHPKFSTINKGTPYAIMKKIPNEPTDFFSIFDEEIKLYPKKDVAIYDINLYINKYNDTIPTYSDWVENIKKSQKKKQQDFFDILYSHLPKDSVNQYIKENNLDKFSEDGNYKIKGELINGIYVEIKGMYSRPIKVGDKIGNRHGNKGIISKIVPDDMMPKMEDGRRLEVCLSPLSSISRMNTGQLPELHLSFALSNMKKRAIHILNNGGTNEEIKNYILDFIKIADNTNNSWYFEQFKKQIPKKIDEEFIESISIIQPPFESTPMEKIDQAMNFTDTPYTYKLFEPTLNEYIIEEISVGFMYFFRMVHIAESKISFRGIASYSRKTLQPLGGRKNMGGQRMGEMETACLIGHDAMKNLDEFITTKSDSINLKNSYIKHEIESSKDMILDSDREPESVRLFKNCLKLLGLDITQDNG